MRKYFKKHMSSVITRELTMCTGNVFNNNIYTISLRNYSSCPCTPCYGSYLPPPGNYPAKCIYYITGVYYYPYGFWFCGPQHVTGGCTPCCRPPCVPCCSCNPPTLCAACLTTSLPQKTPKVLPKIEVGEPFQCKPKLKPVITKVGPLQNKK